MSTTAISNTTPSSMTSLSGISGTDTNRMEQFLEYLLQDLLQLSNQWQGNDSDNSGSPPAVGGSSGVPNLSSNDPTRAIAQNLEQKFEETV
ncbi:hypothetical protein FAZ69_32940 [Trinickia terrae]|uniref:Uncharacterized protein n=1 Tax=Trinickia terrae TaxID=2571161 RepID=A0A4U1HDG4_9BURK|nr:hypothetical protein [Trinickia terrae]TKC77194.1 hypothetical protein FAZ69_32940 [Trinickia terrae]